MIEKEIEKILWNLSEKTACQKSDILLTIIKENIDVFTKFLNCSFNEVLNFSQFKFLRMKMLACKATMHPSGSFQNCLKRLYMIKSLFFSLISSKSTNVALEKAFVPNNALLQWLKNGRKLLITKEHLIAKLSVYGFDFKALKFIYSYINNSKQTVRIN